ncbi:hypothetical protein [Methylobacterium komagatae]|uniref:hypothetical protein n=1 Tax=Methylobacterium komagatae TaxID=374425 RepID=UPI00366B1267
MSNNVSIAGLSFDLDNGDDEVGLHLADDLRRVEKLRNLPRSEGDAGMNEFYNDLKGLKAHDIADLYLSLLDRIVEQRQSA